MHPWHDLNFGDDLTTTVNAVLEVPKGSKAKYELDKESGLIRIDRCCNFNVPKSQIGADAGGN